MMWIDFDLATQSGNAAVHTPIIDDDVMAPDSIEYLIASDRPPCSPHEEFQKPKFFDGERDFAIVAKKLMSDEVEATIAEIINRRSSGLTPAEKGSGAGEQFA